MTNYEKIIAPLQTTQGLAAFLMDVHDDWCICCGNQDECDILIDADEDITDEHCKNHITQWLESEAK